ncbi:MAG: glycosyltransferase [Candidatus Hydrogenedentota bacterium]|nr:MAG: glycosyltransferase [Candidatus Hydrogenedentota bacterium]
MIIATVVFFLSFGYLAFLMAGYGTLLRYLTRNKPILRVEQTLPVSIVVPAFNEEKNIARKIEDLAALEYPPDKLEILVIDNSSTDRTREIASSYPVTVLSSPRGKINAINEGVRKARFDVIVVTDADTLLKPDAVKSVVSCFATDTVGAVGGKAVVEDTLSFFGRSKMRYHEADWNLRTLEGRLDSVISLDGKLMAFRKSLLPEIPPKAVVDDLEITFRLRSRGYRSVIDDRAVVYETGPQNFKAEIKQIRRRVALTIPVLFNYINMLLNPRFGWFGVLIFPVRRMLAVFSPLMVAYMGAYIFWWNWKVGLVLGLVGLPLVAVTGQYFPIIQQLGIVLGWLDVLTARIGAAAQWEKVD